jgi:GH24 family phage-related lysozyme (muramidase)
VTRQRILVAALTLSAAAFVGRAVHEGYTDGAVIPVKGDVPTLGFGMTQRPDGTPVRMGDRTNPVEALQRTLAYTLRDDAQIKRCVTVPLHQAEYDLMSDFAYQYGVGALCKSSIVDRANAGDYAGSCAAYLMYRFVGKGAQRYDCSTTVDGRPNKRCWGVWYRQQQRHAQCMAAQ